MKTILITGASGFLGGYLIKTAVAHGYSVTATCFRNTPDYNHVSWATLDLARHDVVRSFISEICPDIVIHNGAMTKVDICEKHPRETELVNITATEILSSECQKYGIRFIYISTDLVFDGAKPPYSEHDKPNPLNHYAWSKLQGERAVESTLSCYVIVRPAIIYGPPAILGTSFSEWMRTTWLDGNPTKLFTDQFRTPIYAGNLAEAIMELTENDYTGIIHLAGTERITRYDFGVCLAQHLSIDRKLLIPARISDVPLTGKRAMDVSLDTSLARQLLKTPMLSCMEGIRQAY